MLDSRVFEFPLHHFLFDAFDRKLQLYIEADLINYNNRKWDEMNNKEKDKKYKEPFAVLVFKELEAGFVVCSVPLALSILVFCLEWFITLKDLLVFLFVFKSYFDVKKLEQSEQRK